MKKTLIALGVTAAITGLAQAAENSTTLYGSLGYKTQVQKNNVDTTVEIDQVRYGDGGAYWKLSNDKVWDLDTVTAKLGVKGNEALGNGLEAFYKFEYGFDTLGDGLNNTRYAYIGLKGNFGTLTLGKQSALYNNVTNYNDIYQDNWFGDLNHYGSITGGSKIAKMINYTTPSFAGFQAGIAGVLDGSHEVITSGDEKSFNAIQAGIWYDQNGFHAGLAYSGTSNDLYTDLKVIVKSLVVNGTEYSNLELPGHGEGSSEVWGGVLGYSNDQFQVGLGVEHAASLGEKYNLAGQYFYGPNTFRASIGMADSKDLSSITLNQYGTFVAAGSNKLYTYGLGYQYNFSKRTYSWVEGQYVDWNINDDYFENGYVVRVGIRHDF